MERGFWGSLATGGVILAALLVPLAPINSGWWNIARALNKEPREEVGWPDMVAEVAAVYRELPPAEKAQTAILTNYAEAGAFDIYGPAYDLPRVLVDQNSGWERGYGSQPPVTVIIVSWYQEDVDHFFSQCTLAGRVTNSYGVENEISAYRPGIYVCRGTREPWPELWQHIRSFG
jgi:hypothetical protein